MQKFIKDNLNVEIHENRKALGVAAASAVSQQIAAILKSGHSEVNIIFAAAPSQNEFLAALVNEAIDWSKINAFHMDEYIGLAVDASQGFANFLRRNLFDKVNFKSVNCLNGNATNIQDEITRYSRLLVQYPTDIVCMGIGENTHIAFNDPHVANFDDPQLVKVVDLDHACRVQQVNDGCFPYLDDVPKNALTLTVPALVNATFIYAMVPSELKAPAIYYTLNEPINEKYPSTVLRKHKNATLYIDKSSAKLIKL